MNTIEKYKNQFLRVTTPRHTPNGVKAPIYELKNGITLNAVKGIMNLEGFGEESDEVKQNKNAFVSDKDAGFLKYVYQNGYGVYKPTAKGCKAIFNSLRG